MAAALLIVEDSDADFIAIMRALREIGNRAIVWRANDTGEALEKLTVSGDGQPIDLPTIVLLDLNLPGTDGREVLSEVKASEALRQLPVVVFSTSSNPETVADCYRRGAAGFMVKPFEYDELSKLMLKFTAYWMGAVKLPEQPVEQ